MFKKLSLALIMLTLACVGYGGFAIAADDAERAAAARNVTDSPEIAVEDLGTLKSEAVKDGFVATFSPIKIKTRYCSGSCGGNSVGSWTCPDSKNCYLNCTTNPPTKGCY